MNPLILTGIFDVAKGLIDRFFPDKQKAAEAQLKLAEMQQSGELQEMGMNLEAALAQVGTNNIEATSQSLFIAGWRPAVGWTCALALSYHFVIRDLFIWVVSLLGGDIPAPPTLVMDEIMTLIFGILGLGGLRTYERVKGVGK